MGIFVVLTPTAKVCELGDPGGLARRIASEFGGIAIGLDEQPADECEGVVLVVGAHPAASSRRLTDTPEAEWREVAEATPLRAMRPLQRARRATMAQCGRIVVVAPSVGLIGAGGLSHHVTGIQGIRAMAKSAARQWATDWISVSLIVVPLGLIVSGAGELVPHVGRAARNALRGFAKSLAREWGPSGVTVNVVSPIAYSPAMNAAREADPRMGERLSRQIPLGRVGDPETMWVSLLPCCWALRPDT